VFWNEPRLYDYKYEGTTYTEDNGFAYVLTFKPKKQKQIFRKIICIWEWLCSASGDYTLDEGEN
jgi:hypothetical protein